MEPCVENSMKSRIVITVALLLLCSAGQALGDAFTSGATGPWSEDATWDGSGVPGNGDTVTIDATDTVTVDVPTTIGASAADGASDAITVNGALVVAADVVLTVRGDIQVANSKTITLNEGATLKFDASLAETPSAQNYCLKLGSGYYKTSALICQGEDDNHCVVTSDAGGANGRIWHPSYYDGASTGSLRCNYTDFSSIGTATLDWALNVITANDAFTHCTFTGCGELQVYTGGDVSGSKLTITDCVWSGTLADQPMVLRAAYNTVSPFHRNVVDKTIIVNTSRWTFENNYFHAAPTFGTSFSTTSFTGNFVRNASQAAYMVISSSVYDSYFLSDYATANPRGISVGSKNGDVVVDGCVFEYTGTDTQGDIILNTDGTDTNDVTIQHCILLPNSAGVHPGSWLSFVSTQSGNLWHVYHNTYVTTGTNTGSIEAGVSVGETYVGRAGMVPHVQSNIAWTPATKTAGIKAIRQDNASTPIQDIITPAGWTHNWGWNLADGTEGHGFTDYDSASPDMFSAVPEDGDGGSGDPGFVASTRNLATWGAANYPLACPDGTVAQALAVLQADTSKIAGLVTWVKAGFRPTNYLVRVGHDTATIGSEDYLETGTYTLAAPATASGKTGVASGNFTIALAANQYPGSIIVTPAAAGVAGTFTPATVTLTDADRTKTVTFTPTSPGTGTATITTTDDGSMTNPAGVEYEVTAAGGGGGRIIGGGIIEWKPGQQWPVAMR